MNREILFRGKVKLPNSYRGYNLSYRNGDWVYGLMNSNDSIRGIFVDTNTIGQYTGLIDKNGTKIFEGDIIAKEFYTNSKRTKSKIFRGVVEYKVRSGKGFGINGEDFKSWAAEWNVNFDFGNYEQKYRCYSWGLFFDCEVVGNIYDNPELLQEGD